MNIKIENVETWGDDQKCIILDQLLYGSALAVWNRLDIQEKRIMYSVIEKYFEYEDITDITDINYYLEEETDQAYKDFIIEYYNCFGEVKEKHFKYLDQDEIDNIKKIIRAMK